jgi:hypothetical protein
MIIHTVNDLSNTDVIDFLKFGLKEAVGLENYHPDFSSNPANLFYILDEGRYKHGNYFVMEEDGKYAGSAGWNPYGEVALVLTRAYIPVKYRMMYNMAHYLLPTMFNQTTSYEKLWITCNDYNVSIYNAITRLSQGRSAGIFNGWPEIYKKFNPIGMKVINNTPQYVAEYTR